MTLYADSERFIYIYMIKKLMTTKRSSQLRLMNYSKKYKLRNETVLLHINESEIFPRNISRINLLQNSGEQL